MAYDPRGPVDDTVYRTEVLRLLDSAPGSPGGGTSITQAEVEAAIEASTLQLGTPTTGWTYPSGGGGLIGIVAMLYNALGAGIGATISSILGRIGTLSDAAGTISVIGLLRGIFVRQRVTAHSIDIVSTATTGSAWTALTAGTCTGIGVRNRSGTTIELSIGGTGTALQLLDFEDIQLACLDNSNEWSVRRLDQSNTQVTVQFYRYTR